MINQLESFFESQDEPVKSCLQFLRDYILNLDSTVSEVWKYGMPFYCLDGKWFSYLWIHKKQNQPYIGIVDGNKINFPGLISEKRSRMKIILIDPEKDVPVDYLNTLFKLILELNRKNTN